MTAPTDADEGTSIAIAVGYALLFSVPIGVGVTLMMTKVVAGPLTTPLVVGPGLAIAVVVFALVVVAAVTGEETIHADPATNGDEHA
ncbi:hypothetical protein ACFQJC_07945 [Haloferax namakaokahaiae]|uniref:Cox cluster protein n=1 Tax=Haloferax namakaokahaiae TaxID=1748331 RepID=A0ABD5ZET7_9EURY